MGRALTITASPWWLFVTLASTIVALAPVVSAGSVTHYPDADIVEEWTPSTGTDNYALIDEAGDPDLTDYVRSSEIGAQEAYRVAISTSVPADSIVDSIVLVIHAKKTSALPSLPRIKLSLLDSATTTYSQSANVTLTATATTYTKSWATNPFTTEAWTVDEANATRYRIGVRQYASDITETVYQLNKVVYYHAETPAATGPVQSVIGGVD